MIHLSATDYSVTLNKDLDGLKKGSYVIITKKSYLMTSKPNLSEIEEAFLDKYNSKLESAALNDFDIKEVLLIR